MFMLNNKPLPVDRPFEAEMLVEVVVPAVTNIDINGETVIVEPENRYNEYQTFQFPANWLRHASLEEKQAIGITEVAEPEQFDHRFYFEAGLPKDLAVVQDMLLAQIKQTSYSLLAPSDYKVVRSAETGQAIDQATLDYRASVRAKYQEHKTAIQAATTVDDLAVMVLDFPYSE